MSITTSDNDVVRHLAEAEVGTAGIHSQGESLENVQHTGSRRCIRMFTEAWFGKNEDGNNSNIYQQEMEK